MDSKSLLRGHLPSGYLLRYLPFPTTYPTNHPPTWPSNMTDSTWLILKDHPLTCRGPNIKQTCNRPLNRLLAVWGWYHSSNLYRIAFKPIKEFDLDLRSEKNAFRGKEIKVIFTLLYFTLTWRWRELSFQRCKIFPSTILESPSHVACSFPT